MQKVFFTIYDILATIVFILFYPFVAISRLHTGKDSGTRKIKLGLFKDPNLGDKVIMFHAVSVGEVLSLEKLLLKTKEEFKKYKIVLTTGTKTGQELAHKKYGESIDFITYFPFDIPYAVNNFLNKISPSVVLIAETELWPDFALHCKKRNIPLAIINGRISDSSFGSYRWLIPFFKPILKLYTKIYAQSDLDKERFISLGNRPEDTETMANLKFDIDKPESKISLKKGSSKLIIAGSTHSIENDIVIRVFDKLKHIHKDLKLVIAPRHLERVSDIKKSLDDLPYKYGCRSKKEDLKTNDILILDTLGELKKFYAASDIAFIGGSFNKTGGHNPLEASIFNVPTITGPNIKNFRDIYKILFRANASKLVRTERTLFTTLNVLLNDENEYNMMQNACKTVFEDQKGALSFVISKIHELLGENG